MIDSGKVSVKNGLPAFAVRLADHLLDVRDRFFARQDSREGKKAGLHDRVDPQAQAGFAGDRDGIDDKHPQLFVNDFLL